MSERYDEPLQIRESGRVSIVHPRQETAGLSSVGAPDRTAFAQMIAVLRQHAWLFLAVLALTMGAAAYSAFTEPRVYHANAVLRLAEARRALVGQINDPLPTPGRNSDPMLSLIQLVRSRGVVGTVVDSLRLQLASATPGFSVGRLKGVQIDPRAVRDTIQLSFADSVATARVSFAADSAIVGRGRSARARYGELLDLGTVRFAVSSKPTMESAMVVVLPREQAIDAVLADLVVTPREGTTVVDVTYTDTDPVEAQQVVNAVVESFQAANIHAAQDEARRRRVFLAEQVHQTDSLLMKAQGDLSAFRSRRQLASSQDKLEAAQTALITLDMRRSELEFNRQTLATILTRLRSSDEAATSEAAGMLGTSPEAAASPAIAKLNSQLLDYQTRLDSLRTGPWRSSVNNPDVMHLQEQIKATRDQLVIALNGQITSLDARIAGLRALRKQSGVSLQALPAMEAEEAQLVQRVDGLTSMSDLLRQEYQKAAGEEAAEVGDVAVVDLASVPYVPIWTTGPLKLALGAILGLMLGGGAVFLREAMNTSIRKPEELERLLHVPGLAVIPQIRAMNQGARPRLARLFGGTKVTEEADAQRLAAITTSSLGTEAFRMLRTSLIWSAWGQKFKSIVVTSIAPGEGKTLTASNLAVAFAREGMQVLLIDCDLRRPRLHRMFGVARKPGLVELLRSGRGEAESAQDIASCIRSTAVPGLFLLPCGTRPRDSLDLLKGARTRSLLQELTGRFDLIILDTPPVLATADAAILAALADGVLLVIRAGQTDRSAAQRAYQQLANVGARVVGTVLNDPAGEVARYGSYYYPYDYSVDRR